MAYLDKVLKGLECCSTDAYKCNECPYINFGFFESPSYCTGYVQICADALELLKAYAKTEEQKQAKRKQKRREWQAKYRESHRKQAYQTTKEWRKNNPDKVKAQRARYRQRRKNNVTV